MLEQVFEALKTYDWGMDTKVLQPLDEAVIASHNDAAARKELETQLAAVLKSGVSRDAKDVVCRALRTIGSAASVPTLAGLLADENLAHMACYALERIPAPEAGQALRTALPKATGRVKIGLIASLGVRAEAASIAPLQALLADSDPAVSKSAAYALGATGSLDAAKVLVTAKPTAGNKDAIADASMACAEFLLAAGNKLAAKATYEKVLASSPGKAAQLAATHGLKVCAGK